MNIYDRLTPLLERFPPNARVFFSDVLCSRFESHADSSKGHIHWLKSGLVEVVSEGKAVGILTGPGVIFSPNGSAHTLIPKPEAEIVCAEFEFGQRFNNPLISFIQSVIIIRIADAPEIESVHALLMDEAFSSRCGKTFGFHQQGGESKFGHRLITRIRRLFCYPGERGLCRVQFSKVCILLCHQQASLMRIPC